MTKPPVAGVGGAVLGAATVSQLPNTGSGIVLQVAASVAAGLVIWAIAYHFAQKTN